MIVLDTHIWVWWVHDDANLPLAYKGYIQANESAGLGISAISCWEVAKLVEHKRLSLLQLSEQTCKWPIGDPLTKDFYFCGQHSLESGPYCEFHSRKAYHQLDRKKR